MPIRGLTDRQSVRPTFTPIGQIRKGYKDEQGKMHDLDYFRFVAKGPKKEAVQAAFEAAYGKEPRLIRVVTPYPTVEENWATWREQWGRSGLIHRCDGEFMVQWLNEEKRYIRDYDLQQKRRCPYCSGEKARTPDDPGCSEVGYLVVAIPELLSIGFLGYVTVITTSKNDLYNISASLFDTEQKARIVGREHLLAGVPFAMHRVEENIGVRYEKKNGDVVKTKSDKWMIRLDPTQEWAQQMLQDAMDRAIGLPAPGPAALPEPEVDPETGEVLGMYEEPDEFPNPFGDDSPAEESTPESEPASAAPNLPLNYTEFAKLAIEQLGYKDINHVYETMKSIKGDPRFTPSDAAGDLEGEPADWWAALQGEATKLG